MVLTLDGEEMMTFAEKEMEHESDGVRHLCTHVFVFCSTLFNMFMSRLGAKNAGRRRHRVGNGAADNRRAI